MTTHAHYLWINTKSRQEILDIRDQGTGQVTEAWFAKGWGDTPGRTTRQPT